MPLSQKIISKNHETLFWHQLFKILDNDASDLQYLKDELDKLRFFIQLETPYKIDTLTVKSLEEVEPDYLEFYARTWDLITKYGSIKIHKRLQPFDLFKIFNIASSTYQNLINLTNYRLKAITDFLNSSANEIHKSVQSNGRNYQFLSDENLSIYGDLHYFIRPNHFYDKELFALCLMGGYEALIKNNFANRVTSKGEQMLFTGIVLYSLDKFKLTEEELLLESVEEFNGAIRSRMKHLHNQGKKKLKELKVEIEEFIVDVPRKVQKFDDSVNDLRKSFKNFTLSYAPENERLHQNVESLFNFITKSK